MHFFIRHNTASKNLLSQMATYTDIDSFFCVGVTVLDDDFCIIHNGGCDVCQEREVDAPLIASGSSIFSTPTMKINSR
jgi:hypothetical protein